MYRVTVRKWFYADEEIEIEAPTSKCARLDALKNADTYVQQQGEAWTNLCPGRVYVAAIQRVDEDRLR